MPTYALSGGGADANVFNTRGLACVNLANGMAEIHTPQEHIAVADLERHGRRHARPGGERRVPLSLRRGTSPACWSATTGWRGSRSTESPCVAYPRLTGPVALGDEVVVNTQARDLELGSGGFDVLYANLTRGLELAAEPGAHVMKLPYTPVQAAVRHAEEDGSSTDSLDGMPVVCCSLHSQLAPVCAGARGPAGRLRATRGRRAAGRALGHRSRAASARLCSATRSRVGACFGGDAECVTPWSALAGRTSAGYDVVVCAIGPGIVGNGIAPRSRRARRGRARERSARRSAAGRSSPPASPTRTRASGTGVSRTIRRPCWSSLSATSPSRRRATTGWREAGAGLPLSHMGRGPDDDPSFFAAAFAAGRLARELAA